jgi:hypothetical protein
LIELLSRRPAGAWLITTLFVVCGLAAVQANTFLNNEGGLSWIFAGLTSEAPLDMLFFLKARPPISLFYAPIAAVGFTPFLWMHLLVAALAIPLTASLARHFQHDRPNLPAALVAVSPLYFAGAAAGVQNTDATVGLLLVAWLLTRRRAVAAGLLIGLLMLGRAETAFFAVALATFAFLTPGYRGMLVGMVVLPVIYVLTGAVYHGELLWPLHYPATLYTSPMIETAEMTRLRGSFRDSVTTLLAMTPVIGALAWTSFRGCSRLEKTLGLTAIAFLLTIRLAPLTQLVLLTASPRYALPALPFLCLAIGRGVSEFERSRRDNLRHAVVLVLIAAVIVGLAHLDPWMTVLVFVSVAVCVAAAVVGFAAREAAATTLVVATAAITLVSIAAPRALPLLKSTDLLLGDQARQLDEGVAWIARELPDGGVVITDQHLVGVWLATYAPDLHVDIRHVVTPDMFYELQRLANPATRQFQTVFGTTKFHYARWIFLEDIGSLPGPVFFLLKADPSPRTRDLTEAPLDRVDWVVKGSWLGGQLRRDERSAAHAP